MLAIETLHKFDIAYRDLKPANVLINEDGHCKLTDFGLSKENLRDKASTYSFCGSVAYLAPEVLRREGHTKMVDWYLLGVCLFEMLFGQPPFYSDDSNKMHEDILYSKLKIPAGVSSKCKDLLKRLLDKNPSKRIGSGKKGVEEIKKHGFFKNINWKDIYDKKLELPGVPKPELKSRDFPPSDVFGDYEDFESEFNTDNWSFCKTIIHESNNLM